MVKVNARQCLIDYSYMNNNSSTMCLLKQDNHIEITNLNQVCIFSLYINWDVSHSECKRVRLTKRKKNTVEGLHSPQSRLLHRPNQLSNWKNFLFNVFEQKHAMFGRI